MAQVYCTLVLTDSYLPGAQVLAHSLRDGGTTRKLAVLVTPGQVSSGTVQELGRLYDYVIPVERINNKIHGNLMLMGRLELSSAFTKIHLWRMTQFEKIIYVDADVVALRAPDELFDITAPFAAAPDIGWPDLFNSGVMVIKPDIGTYHGLLQLAQRGISFDGADQGLLNMHFQNWHRIPFTYNVTPSGHYQYIPAYRHFQSNIAMVHFIGTDKPWMIGRHAEKGHAGKPYAELLGRWWAVWDSHYRPLTEQDPAITWSTKGVKAAAALQEPAFAPLPNEYDPNFRRDHDALDKEDASPVSWQPPPLPGQEPSLKLNRPTLPPVPTTTQPVEYIPPMFIPKEHVPYVPREMPYSAYPQSSVSAGTLKQDSQPTSRPETHPEYKQVETPYPFHSTGEQEFVEKQRRLSLEDVERDVNALPRRPSLTGIEDGGAQRTSMPSIEEDEEPEPFEAPMAQWDAARFSPPEKSIAEAGNFPNQVYANEWDSPTETRAWRPPPISAPPKNLHYELPRTPTGEVPKPIFPWESQAQRETTRFFADDYANEEVAQDEVEEMEEPESALEEDDFEARPAQDFGRYQAQNAWDGIPGINEYITTFQRSAQESSVRRGDMTPNPILRVADFSVRNDDGDQVIPTFDTTSKDFVPPTLPVTPNPIRMRGNWRPSAMNDETKYPSADVTSPSEWNPLTKLEELKQAPHLLLQKRSPPSPSSSFPLTKGSPRSPGNILVASSVPVPQLPHHITTIRERHFRKAMSISGPVQSSPSANQWSASSPSLLSGSATGNTSSNHSMHNNSVVEPIRPVARRYNHNGTQTEPIDVIDHGTQSEDEDYHHYMRRRSEG